MVMTDIPYVETLFPKCVIFTPWLIKPQLDWHREK